MKEFLQLMRRFVSPYKKYIGWAILLNILSAVFNVFSFTLLIPILDILFKTGENNKVYEYMEWGTAGFKDVAINNFYYYVSQMIQDNGPTTALIFLGLFLALMTLFKTSCYFASSAVIPEARTAAEKLSMRGEAVTIENIGKTVTDGFERVADGVNNFVNSDKPRTFLQKVGDVFVTIAAIILKICID